MAESSESKKTNDNEISKFDIVKRINIDTEKNTQEDEKEKNTNKIDQKILNSNSTNEEKEKDINKIDQKILNSNSTNEEKEKNTNNLNLSDPTENIKSNKTDLKAKNKPVKELPIEKKPFNQFINDHLIPELNKVFNDIGKEITNINMRKTNRPVAEDECWVIYCEIKETCRFWLSFNEDNILSPKSFTLCRTDEKPSVLESFLIDEKKITLKLIISRILQRLNGQKLIGAN